MKKLLMLTIMVTWLAGMAVSASAYSVSYNPGTKYNTTALTGFSTYGDDMVGMTVRATLADGSVDTRIWAASGSGSGGVSGSGWSLSVPGDTFADNAWALTTINATLMRLFIDGGTGDTVFDVIGDPTYSPGSERGKPFATTYTGTLDATYADQVWVGGVWYGDLYRTLTLDFGSGGFSGSLSFSADADNLKIKQDITPVPEPATMLLVASGMIGLAAFRRKSAKR